MRLFLRVVAFRATKPRTAFMNGTADNHLKYGLRGLHVCALMRTLVLMTIVFLEPNGVKDQVLITHHVFSDACVATTFALLGTR